LNSLETVSIRWLQAFRGSLDLINVSGKALAPFFEDESTSNPPRQAITLVDWGKTHVPSQTRHSRHVLSRKN
jgi:hypothetical protein